jgi:hypothetical protein
MTTQTAPQQSSHLDMILRLERLARQTSLVALETALEAAEEAVGNRSIAQHADTARNVACHVIRASVEMQQAARMYA